jgi:hypothetical protein
VTHDDFFRLAIDPDETTVNVRTTSQRDEIAEHRSACRECAELEKDFSRIMSAARSRDRRIPAISPEVDAVILALGRRHARWNRLERRLPWILLGILAVAASLVFLSMREESSAAPPRRMRREAILGPR